QLGTKVSEKTGKPYPQHREFGKNGRTVRDIDFTDHGHPEKHPNPHQNRFIENATGGTPTRSTKALPLYYAGWTESRKDEMEKNYTVKVEALKKRLEETQISKLEYSQQKHQLDKSHEAELDTLSYRAKWRFAYGEKPQENPP